MPPVLSKPRAVVLALSALLGAIGAFMPASAAQQARTEAQERTRLLELQRDAVTQLQQAARPEAPVDQVRRALARCQPQSRGIGRRTGSSDRARNTAGNDRPRPVAPSGPSSRRVGAQGAGLGRHSRRRVGDRPCPRAARKSAGATRGGRRAWPHVPGQLQPDEARRSCVRGPRVGDGPGAGEHPIARRRRAGAGDLRGRCAAAHENVLRRTDEGPHPRIGLRRRCPVRLRRRWTARHLSGDRGGAHAGT